MTHQATTAGPNESAFPADRRIGAGLRGGEPATYPSRLSCRICGGPLSVHDEVRGCVCPTPRCRRTATLRDIEERRRVLLAAARCEAERLREHVAKRVRPNADGAILAVLPCNNNTTVRLSARRRRSLRNLLGDLLAAIEQAGGPGPAPARKSEVAQETPAAELALLRLGCATCRGHCCAVGADHAFLDTDTMRRYWSAHPEMTAEGVAAAYVERLPERSVRRSCLFHGKDGCTLPRDMRADICNEFYCQGLRDLRAQLSDPARDSVLAINMQSTTPRRAALYDQHGIRQHFRGKSAETAG